MSAAILTNTCAACGAEESLDALLLRMIDDDQVRRLIADVLTSSLPLGGLMVRYLRLHKPTKQKLRMDKCAKVLAELVPDVQRTAIQRNGRTWAVSFDSWKAAFQAVFDAATKGTLTLPLEGNGYLYATLMRMADKAEGQQERETELDRTRPRQDTVQVKGQSMTIGEGLESVYGNGTSTSVLPTVEKPLPTQPRPQSPMVRAIRAEIAAKAARANAPMTDLPTEKGLHDE